MTVVSGNAGLPPELHEHGHSTDLPNVFSGYIRTYLKQAEWHRNSCPKTPSITTKMPMKFCTIYVAVTENDCFWKLHSLLLYA